jgi:WhiB family redox-sensing transcriptional regulator
MSAEPTLLPVLADPGWHDRAACAAPGIDPEVFFPASGDRAAARAAKQVCAGCQVTAECLGDALARPRDQDFGVRGGTSAGERRRLRQRSRPPRTPRTVKHSRAFAVEAWELAQRVGTREAARRLGCDPKTLRRSWDTHALARPTGPTPPRAVPDRAAAIQALRLAEQVGQRQAARQLGLSLGALYRAWDRHQLGRPDTRVIGAHLRDQARQRAARDPNHPWRRADTRRRAAQPRPRSRVVAARADQDRSHRTGNPREDGHER